MMCVRVPSVASGVSSVTSMAITGPRVESSMPDLDSSPSGDCAVISVARGGAGEVRDQDAGGLFEAAE